MAENTKTIKTLCDTYGMGQTALSRRFGIPLRTVQDWYSGRSNPPEYVVNMIAALLDYDQAHKLTVRDIREGMELNIITEEYCGDYENLKTGDRYMIISSEPYEDDWNDENSYICQIIK